MGERLLPLTVGHALLLQRFGNPLAPWTQTSESARSSVALGDIVEALYVLTRPYDAAADGLRSGVPLQLRWWALKLKLGMAFGRSTALAVEMARQRINAYICAHCTPPCMVILRPASKPPGAPVMATVVHELMTGLGMTQPDALSMGMAEALWMIAIIWERAEAVEIDQTSLARALASKPTGVDQKGNEPEQHAQRPEHGEQNTQADQPQAADSSVVQPPAALQPSVAECHAATVVRP